jgi:hypothetical protein
VILTYVYIYIYVTDTTNHHCMYPQLFTMLIHRMIMLTTTYDVPTTSPSSSATTQFTLGKKRNKTHKRKILTRGSRGPFATNTTIILSVSEAWQHLLPKSNSRNKAKSGAGCSYLKNSKGNGWISLRLFITSQPCRRNREFSSNSILQ